MSLITTDAREVASTHASATEEAAERAQAALMAAGTALEDAQVSSFDDAMTATVRASDYLAQAERDLTATGDDEPDGRLGEAMAEAREAVARTDGLVSRVQATIRSHRVTAEGNRLIGLPESAAYTRQTRERVCELAREAAREAEGAAMSLDDARRRLEAAREDERGEARWGGPAAMELDGPLPDACSFTLLAIGTAEAIRALDALLTPGGDAARFDAVTSWEGFGPGPYMPVRGHDGLFMESRSGTLAHPLADALADDTRPCSLGSVTRELDIGVEAWSRRETPSRLHGEDARLLFVDGRGDAISSRFRKLPYDESRDGSPEDVRGRLGLPKDSEVAGDAGGTYLVWGGLLTHAYAAARRAREAARARRTVRTAPADPRPDQASDGQGAEAARPGLAKTGPAPRVAQPPRTTAFGKTGRM